MIAFPESLSLVDIRYVIGSVASLVLEVSGGDKDGQCLEKVDYLRFQHSYAMETNYWACLFTVMDSP
jgi:hypothetical protein